LSDGEDEKDYQKSNKRGERQYFLCREPDNILVLKMVEAEGGEKISVLTRQDEIESIIQSCVKHYEEKDRFPSSTFCYNQILTKFYISKDRFRFIFNLM
ncbi:unnamed protein product, partial [Didymodactylos carnosus]